MCVAWLPHCFPLVLMTLIVYKPSVDSVGREWSAANMLACLRVSETAGCRSMYCCSITWQTINRITFLSFETPNRETFSLLLSDQNRVFTSTRCGWLARQSPCYSRKTRSFVSRCREGGPWEEDGSPVSLSTPSPVPGAPSASLQYCPLCSESPPV